MAVQLDSIFKEFKTKVITPESYHPTSPEELLKAMLTAAWLLQHQDPSIVDLAKTFIKKNASEEQLSFLQNFSSEVLKWDKLKLCSTYNNLSGNFLEYELYYTSLEEHRELVRFHARFKIKDNNCYFVSQTPPLIRLIADPVLQQPGTHFPQHPTPEEEQELKNQIKHAQSILIQTGGAGIAANQCAKIAKPYRFIIVGVFHEVPEHTSGVAIRYPNTKFPQARVMVNPIITYQSKETQTFNHACLSLPCTNRCAVNSPRELRVAFQDPMDAMKGKEETYRGIDGVVLWHELTHILQGKTYMDIILESLTLEDLILFQKILFIEFQRRKENKYLPELTAGPSHLTVRINNSGAQKLNQLELKAALPQMNDETIVGLLKQANKILKKNDAIIGKVFPILSIYSSKKIENYNHQPRKLIRPKL